MSPAGATGDTGRVARVVEAVSRSPVVRKPGVMAIVVRGGEVRPGDAIEVEPPSPPHQRLEPV